MGKEKKAARWLIIPLDKIKQHFEKRLFEGLFFQKKENRESLDTKPSRLPLFV